MASGQKDLTDATVACYPISPYSSVTLQGGQLVTSTQAEAMGERLQPVSECPGQVVVPFARSPQGADRGDRLDLTTSEDMMTSYRAGGWGGGQQDRAPAKPQDVPDPGLGSPTQYGE